MVFYDSAIIVAGNFGYLPFTLQLRQADFVRQGIQRRFPHVLLTGTMALIFLFILLSRLGMGMPIRLRHKAAVD